MDIEKSKDAISIADITANPAPLGLLAFGMTTVLLNLHNSGLFGMGSVIFAMGIFFGGLAQVIAGIMEWKKNNTFGMTAFISYGFFWISLVGLILMPALGWSVPLEKEALVSFLTLWGLFSLVMFIITFRLSIALRVVFGLLTALFLLLISTAPPPGPWLRPRSCPDRCTTPAPASTPACWPCASITSGRWTTT